MVLKRNAEGQLKVDWTISGVTIIAGVFALIGNLAFMAWWGSAVITRLEARLETVEAGLQQNSFADKGIVNEVYPIKERLGRIEENFIHFNRSLDRIEKKLDGLSGK